MGEGVGRWPKGGDVGGGAVQKVHWFTPFFGSLKNLTTGLIWLVRGGGMVGRWPMEGGQGGEMGGGHQRAVWEQQKCIGSPF